MFAETKLKSDSHKDKGGGCQTLSHEGKAMCHHLVWLAHLPLSYPTTTLMLCRVVEAVIFAGEWSVAGLSVLAHTHTPPENRTSRWAEEMTIPIISTLSTTVLKTLHTFDSPFCIVAHSHARKNVRCLMHRILPGFYSRSELGAVFFHPRFPCEGLFTFFLLCVCFPYRFVACVYVFPLPDREPGFSLPFSDCVSLPGGFIVENGLLFPPHFVGCVCCYILGCCRLLWSRFGHDRAKNDSGIVFLAQAVNRLCDCVYALVGLRTVLGAGMGLGLLDKLGVFGNHTDRARELDFFSTTPE